MTSLTPMVVAQLPPVKQSRLQLPTPVPAGTPDSDPVASLPSMRSMTATGHSSAGPKTEASFADAAGRQRFIESMDQGPGKLFKVLMSYKSPFASFSREKN